MPEGNSASAEWRNAIDRARRDVEEQHTPGEAPAAWSPEVWVRDEDAPAGQRAPTDRTPRPRPADRDQRSVAGKTVESRPEHVPRRGVRSLPEEITGELMDAGGTRRGPRLARDLAVAAEAYQAGRYPDAQRVLRPLAEAAPSAAGVRELYGLVLYRLGRWKAAKAELDVYHELTDSVDQLPVVADCERALGHHAAVDTIFEALRQASPGVEILAEGRLVLAGSLADRDRLPEAIAVLSRYEADRNRPKEWHLRTWYALADLYERAGNVPRARALFRRLLEREPDFFDTAERLAGLR